MASYYELCEKAFLDGSFVPLFRADKSLKIKVSQYIPADIPIDWDLLLRRGIYEYYTASKDPRIIEICRDSIKTLLLGSAYEIWCGYNVLFYMVCKEGRKEAPFYIVDDEMRQLLRDSLQTNKEKLKAAKIWQGKNMKEGLWTDITSSSLYLKKKYGFEIL